MEQGFQRCVFGVGLYRKYVDGRIVLVTVYVIDMLIIGAPSDIDQVISEIRERFVSRITSPALYRKILPSSSFDTENPS